jgi:putative membrane protein
MKHEDECDCRGCHHPILKIIAGIVIFILVIAVVARVVGFVFMGSMGMMGSSWGLLSSVIVILFLIWLISWVFGLASGHRHRHWDWDYSDRAIRILKRRYARGEISESEFKRMKRNLEEK